MANTVTQAAASDTAAKSVPRVALKDQRLFREACYVDGAWITSSSGATTNVDNPATSEILGTVPKLGAAETRAAIDAANKAFPAWSKQTGKERAAILRRWFDLMMENQDDLARLMTLEQGKPLTESRGEVAYAAAFLEWFGEEAKRVYGDVIPGHQVDKRIVVIKQPIGVAACITPWNFPLAMITRKAGPAIGAGCTVVLKPAGQTPFSALALAELAERAGVPKGVFNVITGSAKEIGGELTSNPAVRKLSFTGSTEVGKVLMEQCAGTIKKLSLELGGNAPFIVFDDADLDAAVEGAVASKYRNTGQTCVCANRLLVQDVVYDAVALANDTEFGLAAYFYGRDIGRVLRVAEALEYGIVGINTGIISTEVAPFGGVKESGLGREGSKYGLEEFLEVKYLCLGGM